jgi:NAD(P)-dependent dehydrogenase (short-subunit alcohol dehydrogenase family)
MQDLPGKTAFVTGGASGIGLGIAKALLGAGMNVVIADIRDDHLAAATAELGHPERVLSLKLDVTDRAAYARAADAAEARFRKIHILCNNAGVAVVGPTELATFADWDWVMGVNLGGTINGIVTLLPRIKSHGEGGHIVNTASMSGLMPHPGATIYGTSKGAAVRMMACAPSSNRTASSAPLSVRAQCNRTSPNPARPGLHRSPTPAMRRLTNAASKTSTCFICSAPRKRSAREYCKAYSTMNST